MSMRSGTFGANSMATSSLDGLEDIVCEKVRCGWSHKRISRFLQENNPGVRGFSERSVGRFCHSNNIHRTARVDDESLDDAVTRATCMVIVIIQSCA